MQSPLLDAKWVAGAFPETSDRSEVLSWTHHQAAAAWPAPERAALLLICLGYVASRAAVNSLTTARPDHPSGR